MPLKTIHFSPAALKSKHTLGWRGKTQVVALQPAWQETGLDCSVSIYYMQIQEEERGRTEPRPRTWDEVRAWGTDVHGGHTQKLWGKEFV